MKYPKSRNIHRPPHTSLPGTYYFISARTYYALPFLRDQEAKEILRESFDKAVEKFGLEPVSWVTLNNHYHWMFKSPEDKEDNTLKRVSLGGGKRVSLKSNQSDKLQLVKPFGIGKVVGYVHGRSSNLINKFRREESTKYLCDLTPQEFGILRAQFAKKLGPQYIQLDKKRTREFERLLEKQDTEGLVKFAQEVSRVWYQYTDHLIKDEADFYRHLNYTYQNSVRHGYVKDMLAYEFSSIHEAVRRRGKDFVLECFARYPIVDFSPNFEDW